MTTYQGFDVLDATIQNRRSAEPFRFVRKEVLLDNKTGARGAYASSDAPRTIQRFRWFCETRAQAVVLRDFLKARAGRAIPFWVPSYHKDMTLTVDMPDAAAGATIKRFGYAQQMFPYGGARRHIAIYSLGTTPALYRKITAATDAGGGVTESVTFDSAIVGAWPIISTVISFMHFVRMNNDLNKITWYGPNVAEADLEIIDLPREAVQ